MVLYASMGRTDAWACSGARQVEAKYPALLFKQQLDAFVQKIFPMLRDNVKKEVTPQLAACIHAPRAATTRSRRGSATAAAHAPADAPGAPRLPLIAPLLSAVFSRHRLLVILSSVHCGPSGLVEKGQCTKGQCTAWRSPNPKRTHCGSG